MSENRKRLNRRRRRRFAHESLEQRKMLAGDIETGLSDLSSLTESAHLTELTGPLRPEGEFQPIYTWSLAEEGTPTSVEGTEGSPPNNLPTTLDRLYGTRDKWLDVMKAAFDAWDNVIGIKFKYITIDDGQPLPSSPEAEGLRAKIRVAGVSIDGQDGILAEAHKDSGIVIDTAGSQLNFLKQLYMVMLHEIGHVLGLSHTFLTDVPGASAFGSTAPDSVMRPAINTIEGTDLQYDDILNAQHMLGDGYEPNNTEPQAIDFGASAVGETLLTNLSIQDRDDTDVFSIELQTGQALTVRASPDGFTYKRRGENDAEFTTFDGLTRSTLSLEITDGISHTPVQASEPGQSVLIDNFVPSRSGKYYIKVKTVGENNTQAYRLSVVVGNAPDSDPTQIVGNVAKLRDDVASATTNISLPRGTFKLTSVLEVKGNLTITGESSATTILDGQRLTQIISSVTPGVTLTLKKIRLINGASLGQFRVGGAIEVREGNLVLDDVVLLDNQATDKGGAIFVQSGGLDMTDVVAMYNRAGDGSVAENTTVYGLGGAVAVLSTPESLQAFNVSIKRSRLNDNRADNSGGALYVIGAVDILTSQFSHNEGVGGGGAITIEGLANSQGLPDTVAAHRNDSHITDTWITNNSGGYGAAIGAHGSHLVLKQLRIEGNQAEFRAGGLTISGDGSFLLEDSYIGSNRAVLDAAIAVGPSKYESTILNSWIRNNVALRQSGGVSVYGPVRIESTTISENEALQEYGGGVLVGNEEGRALIINSTISLNKANNLGSGVVVVGTGQANLIHTTVTANTLTASFTNQSAGLFVDTRGPEGGPSAAVINSIIAQNGEGGFVTDLFGRVTITHSLIGVVDEAAYDQHNGNGNILGKTGAEVDARLGLLTDNQGKTPTHQLLAGSPAINAGLALVTSDPNTSKFGFDQTGKQRGRPDMGAWEAEELPTTPPVAPTMDAIVAQSTLDHQAGQQNVTLTGIGVPGVAEPRLTISATSSNLAVIGDVTAIDNQDGTGLLRYTPVAGTAGTATITVTLLSAGADRTFGSADDTQVQRSVLITVVNNDSPTTPMLVIAPAEAFEPRANGKEAVSEPMKFTLMLSAASSVVVSVHVRTEAGTATSGAGGDFTAVDQVIEFQPGETTKTFEVPVLSDTNANEPTERFLVKLDQVVGATLVVDSVEGTIYDAPIVLGNPILPIVKQKPRDTPVVLPPVHTVGPITPAPQVVRTPPPGKFGRLLAVEMVLTDVDRNGVTVSLDALKLINLLNLRNASTSELNRVAYTNELISYDVNRDMVITPLDALLVINELNRRASGQSEGEAESLTSPSPTQVPDSSDEAVDLAIMDLINKRRQS